MNAVDFIIETMRSLWAARLLLWLIGGVVAAATLTIAATAGQAAVAEAAVSRELRAPSSRVTALTSPTAVDVRIGALEVYAAQDGVQAVIAVGAAADHRPQQLLGGGDAVALRQLVAVGSLGPYLRFPTSTAEPGVYLASRYYRSATRNPGSLIDRAGNAVSVRGYFETIDDALGQLADGAIEISRRPRLQVRTIYVVSTTAEQVQFVTTTAPTLFGSSADQVTVSASRTLDRAREAVETEVDRFSRVLLVGVAAVGAMFVLLIVSTWAVSRQRDFGRRRALGARRSTLALFATAQATVAGTIGSIIGILGINVAAMLDALDAPPIGYQVAAGWLMILTASVGAFVPASLLSLRDPVRILRTP